MTYINIYIQSSYRIIHLCLWWCENMSDEVAPLRLDQILAETWGSQETSRARRSGSKPGPGRPDFVMVVQGQLVHRYQKS